MDLAGIAYVERIAMIFAKHIKIIVDLLYFTIVGLQNKSSVLQLHPRVISNVSPLFPLWVDVNQSSALC